MPSVKGSSAISIIVAIIVLAVLIWNVVYISDIRKQIAAGKSLTLNKTAADIIFWVDIILIILIGIYLIYNIVIIFTTSEQRTYTKEQVTQILTQSNSGKLPIIRSTPAATTTTVVTEK